MKNVLILLDGNVAKRLLKRIIQQDTPNNNFDIVYTNDNLLPKDQPKNYTFYKFDPTSYSKLEFIMEKVKHNDILVVQNSKEDTIAVVNNIVKIRPEMFCTVYNAWDIEFKNEHIKNYDSLGILSNGLLEQLPNVPVLAQNVGLKQGEIMEINIPYGSLYAYRYIGSIEQKNWKIFAVYRNNTLIDAKATVILKPNDVILIIGKPKVLLQVYSSISNLHGNFPMPFGNNIYVYIDMYVQSYKDAINCIVKAEFLNDRLKNKKLIVKIVRPSKAHLVNKLKKKILKINNCTLEFEYSKDINEIIKTDKKRFDIGVVILSSKLLMQKYISNQIIDLKIAVFKAGKDCIDKSKESKIILNNEIEYEQISPIIFDLTSLFNHKIVLVDTDPIGDINRDKLIDHFKNLSDIYNQNIQIIKDNKNPIRMLKKQNNTLQIMPLKSAMFKQNFMSIFSLDSDLIAYSFTKINQILIPIVEDEIKKQKYNRRIDDI